MTDGILLPGVEGIDEMVDGARALRPHWRALIGAIAGLGEGGLAERARRLDAAFEDEGIAAMLPGAAPGLENAAWRCDPVPLPIPAREFAALEIGLAQRASLMEAVLGDLYGRQTLLADGILPPALVFANPGFLRLPPRPQGAGRFLDSYAADLIRGPDGAWMVLADRCNVAGGIAYARENRRLVARVMPEAGRGMQVRQLRPFFDHWQDALQRMARSVATARAAGRSSPGIALLTPGTASPHWFEHMFLSRELSCALVEAGDLTVREGAVYLKTLKGLQPVDLLLRGLDGRMIDPLELDPASLLGVPGLLDAARGGAVRISNDPGTAAMEAPAFAAWLPALALRLLDERLMVASVPTMWLGTARARAMLAEAPERWLIRPATDGRAASVALAGLEAPARAALLARIAAQGGEYAASAALAPSLAPCAGLDGLQARPVVLRLFLIHDGTAWRAMEGGFARVVEPGAALAGALPRRGLAKDVWVLSEERADIIGPAGLPMAPMPIRRTSGELPSRVADNLFWLGRYVERLEGAARLVHATLARMGRDQPLPREEMELRILAACLAKAGLVPAEMRAGAGSQTALAEALLAGLREGGAIATLFGEVARLVELVRDRLTGDMYATITHALRHAHADAARARRSTDQMAHAMASILRFAASVAGVAAENMVRGGGWLFLDLGRRIERAQAVLAAVAFALDQPPPRIEAGLRLLLELCDSAITYRSRYLTVLQPGPVLDLVLADEGNPRAAAFQLEAIWHLLNSVGDGDDAAEGAGLPASVAGLLAELGVLVRQVIDAPDQSEAASALPAALRGLDDGLAALSDRITRRYFALLPLARAVGLEVDPADAAEAGLAHGAAA